MYFIQHTQYYITRSFCGYSLKDEKAQRTHKKDRSHMIRFGGGGGVSRVHLYRCNWFYFAYITLIIGYSLLLLFRLIMLLLQTLVLLLLLLPLLLLLLLQLLLLLLGLLLLLIIIIIIQLLLLRLLLLLKFKYLPISVGNSTIVDL